MDNNLKYAILDELRRLGIFEFDKADFFEKKLKKEYDMFASYNYQVFEPIKAYFDGIDLKKFPLEKAEQLTWTSYADTLFDIWNQYDGEDDFFNIGSLEGIEMCPNIKSIHIEYVWSVTDLSPLAKLTSLEEITIFSGEIEVNSLAPLLDLPALKEVSIEGMKFKDPAETNKVIESLKEKGVKTDVN